MRGCGTWDSSRCMCSSKPSPDVVRGEPAVPGGTIAMTVMRGGQSVELALPDPVKVLKAGDKRIQGAGPELTLNPI